MHFTPTSASWLNMVERFFRDLTQNRLRRGVFRDLEELIMAIGTYIDRHDQNPKPFIWSGDTAEASQLFRSTLLSSVSLPPTASALQLRVLVLKPLHLTNLIHFQTGAYCLRPVKRRLADPEGGSASPQGNSQLGLLQNRYDLSH